MAKEPKPKDRDAQGTEQKDNREDQRKEPREPTKKELLKEFLARVLVLAPKSFVKRVILIFTALLKNATLVLSLLYIYVTAIGLLYSRVLYGEFGINIFDFSEIGDFFIAALRNPSAILVSAEAIVISLTLLITGEIMDKLGAGLDPTPEEWWRFSWTSNVIFCAILAILLSFILPIFLSQRFADNAASSIKEGKTSSVVVHYRTFSGSAGQVSVPGVELIGATQKAAFFYDVDDNHTLVIPQSQIVSIEVPD